MDIIKAALAAEYITEVGFCAAEHLRAVYPHLMPRIPISGAIVFLIPYYYPPAYEKSSGLSKYAFARDYHIYSSQLYKKLIPQFESTYTEHRFYGYCDASPIDERHAAACAGLGILGKNSLLINKAYGSFCFIGSILTTYLPIYSEHNIEHCENCGLCERACPASALSGGKTSADKCLSALSQKKHRTADELLILRKNKTVWGCDVCQDVCPHNCNIKETPIPFFRQNLISDLSVEGVRSMSDAEFSERAFAWRGRQILLENLTNLE